MKKGKLLLANGDQFFGDAHNLDGIFAGEVVFNTSMTGYGRILSDPSYKGQIICFTWPLVGNYGINRQTLESTKIHAAGAIFHQINPTNHHPKSDCTLVEFLTENNIPFLTGVDTRQLTLTIRQAGTIGGLLANEDVEDKELLSQAQAATSILQTNLPSQVSCLAPHHFHPNPKGPKCAVLDFGVKTGILLGLADNGFDVTLLPHNTPAKDILAGGYDCCLASNGPGNPEAVDYGAQTIKDILGKIPFLGICLGHQLLARAIDAKTFKLPYGHRGGNHPVKDLKSGTVWITSQNHGFAVDPSSMPSGSDFISQINLGDNTVEGLSLPHLRAFSVQYHPEAKPGPLDSYGIFDKFFQLVTNKKEVV